MHVKEKKIHNGAGGVHPLHPPLSPPPHPPYTVDLPLILAKCESKAILNYLWATMFDRLTVTLILLCSLDLNVILLFNDFVV